MLSCFPLILIWFSDWEDRSHFLQSPFSLTYLVSWLLTIPHQVLFTRTVNGTVLWTVPSIFFNGTWQQHHKSVFNHFLNGTKNGDVDGTCKRSLTKHWCIIYNCHYEFKLMICIWKTYLSFSTAVYPEGQYFFTAAKDGSIKVHCNIFCIRREHEHELRCNPLPQKKNPAFMMVLQVSYVLKYDCVL